MDFEAPEVLLCLFDEVEDPRVERCKLHPLSDILVITLCAVICGANTWTEVELFGRAKFDWFRTFLELPGGRLRPATGTISVIWVGSTPEACSTTSADTGASRTSYIGRSMLRSGRIHYGIA